MTRHLEGSDGILDQPVRRIEADDIGDISGLSINPDGTTTLSVRLTTGEVLAVPGLWEHVEVPR